MEYLSQMTTVITYHRVYNYINTTCATSGAGTAYHSIVPELNQLFQLYRGGQFNFSIDLVYDIIYEKN